MTALPADLQAVIDANSGLEFSAFAGRDDAGVRRPRPRGRGGSGNTIITLTPAQVAEWRAASQPIVDTWMAEMDAAGIDGTALLPTRRSR